MVIQNLSCVSLAPDVLTFDKLVFCAIRESLQVMEGLGGSVEKVLMSKFPWLNAHQMSPEPGVRSRIKAGEDGGRELSQDGRIGTEWSQY